MTRYEKDMQEALSGNATEVLKSRKAELERLTREAARTASADSASHRRSQD